MSSPQVTAIILVVLSLIYFFYLGLRNRSISNTERGFFRADGTINATGLGDTIAAAGISNAAVAVAYITLPPQYGFWLLLAVVANLSSLFITKFVIKKAKIKIESITTIGRLVYERSSSDKLFRLCELITSAGFLAALLVEFIIGSYLFAIVMPGIPMAPYVGFFAMTVIVLAYISIGGINAAIGSDSWQLRLIFLGAISLLITAISLFSAPDGTYAQTLEYVPTGNSGFVDFTGWVIVTIILSCFAPIGQLSNWQRLSATKESDRVPGINRGLRLMALLYLLFFISGHMVYVNGIATSGWGEIFHLQEAMGGVFSQVFYPLLFTGLVATIISTADTNALAIIYSWFSRLLGASEEIVVLDRKRLYRHAIIVFVLLFLGFFIYDTIGRSNTFLLLIFLFFGIHVLLAPLVYVAIATNRKIEADTVFWGLTLSFISILLIGLVALIFDKLGVVFWGNIVGFVGAVVTVCVGTKEVDNVSTSS